MGCRIKILLFLFCLIANIIVKSAFAVDEVAPVKVMTAGKSELVNFSRDEFAKEDKHFTDLSNEDRLTYAIYQSLIYDKKYSYLFRLIEQVKDRYLKLHMLSSLYLFSLNDKVTEEVRDKFYNITNKEQFEALLLLIEFQGTNFGKIEFKNEAFNAFAKASKFALDGNYSVAIETLKPFATVFPFSYYYFLIMNDNYREALDFVSKIDIENKKFLEALCYYYLGDCEKVLEKLSLSSGDHNESLLYIDCVANSSNLKIDIKSIKKSKLQNFERDPYFIFKNMEENKGGTEQAYRSFYYIHKLNNHIKNLTLYKQEIQTFVEKMEEVNQNLKKIVARYESEWEKIEKSADMQSIRKRILVLLDKTKDFKAVSFKSHSKEQALSTFLDKQYNKHLALLENEYNEQKKKEAESLIKLQGELDARLFLKELKNRYVTQKEEFLKLQSALNDYYAFSIEKELSLKEAFAFAKISLSWNFYQHAQDVDQEAKLNLLNTIVFDANEYVKHYKERQKEVLLVLAEAYSDAGEIENALNIYRSYLAVEAMPSARTLMKIGELLFEKADYSEAANYFDMAGKKDNTYKNAAYYKIGWCYYLSGKLNEVATLFLNYQFDKHESKAEILFDEMMDLLSRVFYKLGSEKFEDYLKKFPKFPIPERLFKSVGDLHLFLADYQKAIEIYEKGINSYYIYQGSPELLSAKIEVLTLLAKFEEANEEKVRFVDIYGKRSQYFSQYGVFPKQYKDNLVSAGFYYNASYEKEKNEDAYQKSVNLYIKFLEEFPLDEKAGEVAFYLAQLEEDKALYVDAAKYFRLSWQLKFKEKEALYRYLYCKYKLWQAGSLAASELVDDLKNYINNYPATERSTAVLLVLVDILAKENRQEEMLQYIEDAVKNQKNKDITKLLDFCEANFEVINDKDRLAKIFEMGYVNNNNKHYLELKHYAMFVDAKQKEDNNQLEKAALVYREIINDYNKTSFEEFAVFNLGLLLEKIGKTEEAIDLMERINQKDELKIKAKDFIYTFGKKRGLYQQAASAALMLSNTEKDASFYLLEALWLYLKAKDYNAAENVLAKLDSVNLNENEKRTQVFLKSILIYEKGDALAAFDGFLLSLKSDINAEFENDFIYYFHNVLKKVIFLKPEDDARDALEAYVEFLGKKFRERGKAFYLYNIAETLYDFSLFFLQKDEAISRAIEFYKRSLKLSVLDEDKDLVLKNIVRLKELQPDFYNKPVELPEPRLDFIKDIKYGEIYVE